MWREAEDQPEGFGHHAPLPHQRVVLRPVLHMTVLTFEVRQLIREHRDQRRREVLSDEEHKTCTGCGADYAAKTKGCRACTDRHRNRTRPGRDVKRGQCQGVTYYGSRCMNTALDGEFCYAHQQVPA